MQALLSIIYYPTYEVCIPFSLSHGHYLLVSSDLPQVFEPPPSDYQDTVSDIMSSFLTSLCSMTRLFGDEELMQVVLGEKADDVEKGSELQDLVSSENFDDLVRWQQCLTISLDTMLSAFKDSSPIDVHLIAILVPE